MTRISRRLSVEGPDRDDDFEVSLDGEITIWHYITRAEANALIVALGGTPPQSPSVGEAGSANEVPTDSERKA